MGDIKGDVTRYPVFIERLLWKGTKKPRKALWEGFTGLKAIQAIWKGTVKGTVIPTYRAIDMVDPSWVGQVAPLRQAVAPLLHRYPCTLKDRQDKAFRLVAPLAPLFRCKVL